MQPATDRQKSQLFFIEPKADIELNAANAKTREAFWNSAAAESDWAQNTTCCD